MKNVLYFVIAALLIAATCGCNSCGSNRRSWFSWFNQGDSCRTCNSGEVVEGPGMIGTPILNNVPASPRSSGFENLPSPLPLQ
jgi:hypothetical protein